MSPVTPDRSLEWRGRTVAWQRLGEGPALVLLHGTPWSSALWQPVAEALARRFTVYLWDMPGYGASSKNADHRVDLGSQGEPVHIVWGADDTWIPVDRAHRLRRLIPHATLTVLDDAGHLVQLDAPAQLAAELTRWTESVR